MPLSAHAVSSGALPMKALNINSPLSTIHSENICSNNPISIIRSLTQNRHCSVEARRELAKVKADKQISTF